MKRFLLAVTFVFSVASLAHAQFTPFNVRVVDPTSGLPVPVGTDGAVGTAAQSTGPSIKCYGSAIAPSTVANGQDQYVWCTGDGRVVTASADPCSGKKTVATISQTTSTQLFAGTASNRIYVCSFMVTQPATSTQTYSLVSGTGTVCATSTGPVIGATSAANGMAAIALPLGNGLGTIAKSDTDAENICLLQSGTDRIAGVMTYVVAPN